MLGRIVRDIVEAGEQRLARQAAIPAVGVVDEGQHAVGPQAQDELGLALDDRAVPRLALPQRFLRLLPGRDVDGQQHPAAVGHPALANADPAAVGVLVLALGPRSSRRVASRRSA